MIKIEKLLFTSFLFISISLSLITITHTKV